MVGNDIVIIALAVLYSFIPQLTLPSKSIHNEIKSLPSGFCARKTYFV